ncbi:MAG: phosphoribosylformimino-5-aminoimidazole carboxamide ribotide isomerase, partial [Planctomycetes bacterium]|nr:phosphoribosylformimino-5-aminoimidazole carboxamide ribotide isomerase [Planctomycetota bacterium]
KRGGIDWSMLSSLKERFGAERVVLAPDVRNDMEIHVDRWKTNTGIRLDRELMRRLAEYCGEFLIHSIEVEGLEGGVDQELVDALAGFDERPVTYAGGGADLAIVEELHNRGLDITIGKAYFNGRIRHEDLVALNSRLAGNP